MANLEREELIRQYQAVVDFLEDTAFEAHILEENPAIPMTTLIIGISEELKEGRYIACNLIPLVQEEAAYTNFLQMFFEVPYEMGEADETELLRAVNAMNGAMPAGHFIYNRISPESARVQLRLVIPFDVEEPINPATVCECACMILEQGAVMEEILSGILAGMELEEILKAEHLL